MSRWSAGIAAAAILLLAVTAHPARADDPCAGFKWNVERERALFAGTAASAAAARDAAGGAQLQPDVLYELTLAPQQQVSLSVPAGNKSTFDGAFAGFARLQVPTAGVYRVSLSRPGWIDLIGEHGAIASSDFSGQHGCNAPHKVVQFQLPAGSLVLQLTGVDGPRVTVTLTRAPASP
jgi:hypothetical protein